MSSKLLKIFSALKDALAGKRFDYTSGSISKAVFLLAVPMILELSLESVFAVVDIFFVSKLGENAIATVGLTESVITILYSIAIGLSTAAGAIVARRIGEKDSQGAAKSGAQSIIIALLTSTVLSIAGIIWADDILRIMGASDDVIRDGAIFTKIMFGGSLSIILIFLINGIFRGAGNAAMAMKSLWFASLINIILCPLFIHFFGLKGAAIATVTGRSCGVIYQCWHLFNGKNILTFFGKYFMPDRALAASICKVAGPAALQFLIGSGSWIILSRLVAETGGTAASAGYQIAIRNMIFFMLPAWGLSNAAATLVGQNLGANQPDRAEKSVWITAKYLSVFLIFVTILFTGFAPSVVQIFTADKEVAGYAVTALRIVGTCYVFFGFGMVMTQAINGAGDTKTPTLMNLIAFWLFQIPLAYALVKFANLGPTGCFLAFPAAEVVIAALGYYHFKKGKWKLKTV